MQTMTVEEIKHYCTNCAIDQYAAMIHVHGDYNLSTLVRNANFFGFKGVFYVGGKRDWDRRGSVGTHNYTPMTHYKSEQDFIDACKQLGLRIVAVENNIPKYVSKTKNFIPTYTPVKNSIYVFGEEQAGLSDLILDNVDEILTLPAYGSVRSINVGSTSAIILYTIRHNYAKSD